jgi:hypothetical protein
MLCGLCALSPRHGPIIASFPITEFSCILCGSPFDLADSLASRMFALLGLITYDYKIIDLIFIDEHSHRTNEIKVNKLNKARK